MKKGPNKMMLESSRYDKWERGGGGGAGGGGGPGTAWTGRDRDRDRERERERQARAHQMSHAPEPDASSLFPAAPVRVITKDHVSRQIQNKLGDYRLAQTFLDDPSKSIGICAEPPSPAPCRRDSEFKKPSHALQNGRVHHRPYYPKSEAPGSTTSAPTHRPPPLRIPNGVQHQSTIDSSQPPIAIESILKEMKSLPTPLSVMAATPRKELENKFIFNPYTNKVQENPQITNNDLKIPITKPGLDNRIADPRSPISPDVVGKDLGLSESDDENAAATTRLHPILSPIESGASPSSGSESSATDSESESSSTESSGVAAPPPAPAQEPPVSWGLKNFAPPSAQPVEQTSYAGKELEHALADVKGKPSPISDLSDSSSSSPSAGSTASRRRSHLKRRSPPSSDDEPSRDSHTTTSPRVAGGASSSAPVKRGRPPKARVSEERPAKKKRGRPKKQPQPVSPPAHSPSRSDADSDAEPPSAPQPPPQVHPLPFLDPKSHIVRKVFTPKKSDECGGKGGKGGKGKGGKGKGQVTIIEVTASESGADDDDRRDRTAEIKNEEAVAARLSPEIPRRRDKDRLSNERTLPEKRERISDRICDRLNLRLPSDKISLGIERPRCDPVQERYVKAEADVGVVKSERTSERIPEPCSVKFEEIQMTNLITERRSRNGSKLMVQIPLARLRPETIRALRRSPVKRPPDVVKRPTTPPPEQVVDLAHDRSSCGQTPIYYSYFERLPPDTLSDEERDHKYYLGEATRLRTAAEREQEPLQRVMLYLESVLCFVLTGRVLELELETKQAFTIYRETIEYIKSIHSMPQRYRASPHSTFSKLDILSLRVQALLYLRMFKMYNREIKDYYKIVQEYQQKPAIAESVSPLSPTPSPAGSVGSGSVGSGSSSGCYSLAHSVPANTHNALLQLTKYYTFLYVAHELWEQADCLCRLRANQDLFIAVDRKCGPLTLFSTFRHLVQYVRYAISLLKHAPRE